MLTPKYRPKASSMTIDNLDQLTDEQIQGIVDTEDIRKYDIKTRIGIAKRLRAPEFMAKTPGEIVGEDVGDASNAADILFGSEDEVEEELF